MKQTYFIILGIISILSGYATVNGLSNSELSLIGTTWSYEDNLHDWKYDLTFLENGQMETTHPNDNTTENDVWKQDRTIIEFSFNDEYSIYKGKRRSTNQITGKAKSSNGKKWKLYKK
jgi:hypothetical protein